MQPPVDTAREQHQPGQTFDVDDKFTTPCSCGRRFTASTPSTSRSRHKKHHDDSVPKPAAQAPVAERIRECGCGCGGKLAAKAGGLFLSGHDARFKSVLTKAHADHAAVRHPQTGMGDEAINIAKWLDERRGGGTFWQDRVRAGHRVAAEKSVSKSRRVPDDRLHGEAKAAALIASLEARRPAAGQEGQYVTRDGQTRYPAKVVRRASDTALQILVQGGPMQGQQVIVPDDRFEKTKKTGS
jgi:hypothetical protein